MITLRKVRVTTERGYIEYLVGAAEEINAALTEHGLGGSVIEERVPAYKGEPLESASALPRLLRWFTTKGIEEPAEIAPGETYMLHSLQKALY